MQLRTDLALEAREFVDEKEEGVVVKEEEQDGIKISEIKILNQKAAKKMNKPIGTYITAELAPLTDNLRDGDSKAEYIGKLIEPLLPKEGTILIAGIGNETITPDALGPKSADNILATRHIAGELKHSLGLSGLRSVAVLAPGVLGQTGIETGELIKSVVESIKPSAVIAIDALASRSLSRLGCTIQISDAGISPGSGVGNHRLSLNKETMGIPVIGIGVPTVVDAQTLALELIPEAKLSYQQKGLVSPRGEQMIVTPREIDLLIERASRLVGMSLNCALHKGLSVEDFCLLLA
ncbi:GPR endopeptidase [Pseudoruminococcus massiliensis]|uniref:GPR endopeptidase n=1 Tax=Pseudoruminococcus massiliensis TaxID=2086583 RepID=UPI00402665C2